MTGTALTPERLPTGPAEARGRVHEILSVAVDALRRHGAPDLELVEHRPRRDRASGTRSQGVRTLQHVSALIGSTGEPPASPSPSALLGVADRALRGVGLSTCEDGEVSGVRTRVWTGPAGDRAEVVVGARLLLRVISAPFLPGVEQGDMSTTPSAVRRVLRPGPGPHETARPLPVVAPAGMPLSAPTPEPPFDAT